MTELSIRPEEIRDALAKYVADYQPDAATREEVGTVASAGDGIARVSGQVAALGLIPLINLAAILSISIGLINLFPIPMLDGGHLAFYAIEALRGRPLPERAQEIGFGIGFAIVLGLMAFGVLNDIAKIASG